MIFHNLHFTSRLLVFFISYHYFIVAAGVANAGRTLQLSTSSTQRTAVSSSALKSPGVNWTAPADQEYLGRTAPVGDLTTLDNGLPSPPLRKVRGRRGAASRSQPRYGEDWGSRAGTAEVTAVSQVRPQRQRKSGISIFSEPEQQGPQAVTVPVNQQATRENEAAVMSPRGDPNQWWRTRVSTPVHDSWMRMQVAEDWSVNEADAALQEQEAASAAGLIPERRMREAGRPPVNRLRSTVPLPLFLASIVTAAVVGGLVTRSLMRSVAATRTAREHKSASLLGSWIPGANELSQGTTSRDVNARANATVNNVPYNGEENLVDGLTLVTMLMHALPILIFMWSPTAAALMLLHRFLTTALPQWEMHQKQSSPAGGHPNREPCTACTQVQMITTWLSKLTKAK